MRRSALVAAVATTVFALSGCGTAQPTPSELASASAQASANQVEQLMPRARAKAQEVAAEAEAKCGASAGTVRMPCEWLEYPTECQTPPVDTERCARALIRDRYIK